MPKTMTRPYESAEYLRTDEDMAAYLDAALEDGDPELMAHAVRTVARARGLRQLAQEADLPRETLDQLASPEAKADVAGIRRLRDLLAGSIAHLETTAGGGRRSA